MRANILLFTFPFEGKYTVRKRNKLETYTDEGFIHVLMGLFTAWVSDPHHIVTRLSSGWGTDKTINRTLSRDEDVWAALKTNTKECRTCAVELKSAAGVCTDSGERIVMKMTNSVRYVWERILVVGYCG